MINMSTITTAVEKILNDHTAGYEIQRNGSNDDPNVAAKDNGWIGIRKGAKRYEAYAVGSTPWLVDLEIIVEVQYAQYNDPGDAEDHIEDAVEEILGVLNDHSNLDGTVSHLTGFDVAYQVNYDTSDVYYYAAVITVRAQSRA